MMAETKYRVGDHLHLIPCPNDDCEPLATLFYSECPCCQEKFIECGKCGRRWSQEELAEET